MPRNDIHLEPGCPWYELSEMRLPNVKWCENNLCSWVVNPANTWSNLPYIFFGIWLMMLTKSKKAGSLAHAREKIWLGFGLVMVGGTSLIYHASYNFATQILDFIGMYWFLLFVFYANLVRLQKIKPTKFFTYWLVSVAALTAFTVAADFLEIKIQALVMILSAVLLIQELMIDRSKKPEVVAFKAPSLKYIYLSAVSVVIAATCSALDLKRIWCDPDNHWLQGHAVWHLFSCACLFFLSLHLLTVKPFLKK